MKEIVELNDIGPVQLTSGPRTKRLTIRVKPFKGIEVAIPHGTPPSEVARFLKTHHEWMRNALAKVKIRENDLTIFDEQTQFKTRTFTLKIEAAPVKDVRLVFRDGFLKIFYPKHIDVKTRSVQEVIRYGIEEALRREAKAFLPVRLRELANLHGFKYASAFIKNLKSRWGSCSSTNNINLNLHLMRLPDHLIDYVLLHELCHTVEKNHGQGFWRLMDKVTDGRAGAWEKEMKKHRTVIY
ncbi:MAG: SprT family zinc-dependent metalloprotease [Breznakibacter sp.]